MNNWIKSLRALALAVVIGALTAPVQAAATAEGEQAFLNGDYAAAIRAYESALATDGPSAGLYFNLATAQLRTGEPAAASLNLRRAILLDPGMTDARMALSDLERAQGVPAPPRGRLAQVMGFLSERVPSGAFYVTGAVVAWAGAFWLLAVIFGKGRRVRPALLSVGVLVCGAALVAVGVFSDPRLVNRSAAVVMAGDGITLRSSPADQSAAVAKLPAAAAVHVLGTSGEWTFCATPSGEKGWTASSALEPVIPRT